MSSSSSEKRVMVLAMDQTENSQYALEWSLDHFFTPFGSDAPFDLVIVYAKPFPSVPIGTVAGPTPDLELKLVADQVTEKAKQICTNKSVHGALVEIVEGDARNVLCDAVDRHRASLLVLGSRGYGAIKRVVLGSVSDHCTHHAHCSVMIVKKPKSKK
ncbi:universal stress protein PHOS34-like isoform X3 [Arachis stenosperma]|uniref:universal stress protein PHOS34-like isoform X3 n=1 Tax=Arachis stenosperma TaxID=217475 RepID=UPI0025AC81E9|nr:universal stress protein PHOS34-like isoform X3 [Arachis stenosperma]